MSRWILLGGLALLVTLLLGAWLVAAPFVTQAQPAGHAWVTATMNDVATGGVLVAVSLAGLLAVQALWVRDLVDGAREAGPLGR